MTEVKVTRLDLQDNACTLVLQIPLSDKPSLICTHWNLEHWLDKQQS